jgi:hypothetical protein
MCCILLNACMWCIRACAAVAACQCCIAPVHLLHSSSTPQAAHVTQHVASRRHISQYRSSASRVTMPGTSLLQPATCCRAGYGSDRWGSVVQPGRGFKSTGGLQADEAIKVLQDFYIRGNPAGGACCCAAARMVAAWRGVHEAYQIHVHCPDHGSCAAVVPLCLRMLV